MASEYFWLYAGGGGVVVLGFLFGLVSIFVGDAGPEHWTRPLSGWFPAGWWSESDHWIGFLLEGILLTLAGLGITRHRWLAWWLLVGVCAFEAVQAARKLVTGEPGESAPIVATAIIVVALGLLLLAARLALSLRRTPPRDIRRLQAREL